MATQPSVLILDDGELSNIHQMLLRLGRDVVRLEGPEIGASVLAPRDLLISAGRRTLQNMPELLGLEDAAAPPIWVCIHNQDFLPMRQRMREMGVHYLLQGALDEQSRERFLIQLFRKGVERRGSFRLYLGGELQYRIEAGAGEASRQGSGDQEKSGKLVELSADGCRILLEQPIDTGTHLTAILPPEFGAGKSLELTGIVRRAADREAYGGRELYAAVIGFDEPGGSEREQLAGIIRGERIGTKVTPLAIPVEGVFEEKEEAEQGLNRRAENRHEYERPARVLGYGSADANPVLGCDLSLGGVRLSDCPGMELGSTVTVALYGAAREEPTVLEATVIRTTEDGDVALEFGSISPSNRRALEKLLSDRPLLDALDQPDPEAGRTIVAAIRTVTPS